jgi:hypothetical protein
MGQGGGGMGGGGGSGPCASDAACADDNGPGSLCVGDACTKASGACDATRLVVVAPGRRPDDAALAEGCHFRDLDGAREALGPSTARLAVYADSASSTAPLAFTKAASLEGHHADATKAVALTLPAGSGVLVRFAQGGALRGVGLAGDGKATAVRVEAGSLAVAGPTTVTTAGLGLEVTGEAKAVVTGSVEQRVLVTSNARGIYVGATASLEVTGVGGESVVIEKADKGAGVLVEKGVLTKGELSMKSVLVRDNQGSDSSNGSGGVEVRGGRKATVSNNTFSGNNTSVSFSGQGASATVSNNTFSGNNTSVSFQGSPGDLFDAFKAVTLADNDFTGALPVGGGGVVICGRSLGASGTTLTLGSGNQFPNGGEASPGTCQTFEDAQEGSCTGGGDIDFESGLNKFDVVCQ